MNKKPLFWILTVPGVFIFQVFSSDFLSIFGVFPNFLLLGAIFFAIRGGPEVGVWTGFALGLLADVASLSIFGSQTFMLTLVGYGVGRFEGKIDEERPAAQVGLVLLTSIFFVLGLLFFETIFGGSGQRFRFLESAFQPLYSAAVSPAFFWVLVRWRMVFGR